MAGITGTHIITTTDAADTGVVGHAAITDNNHTMKYRPPGVSGGFYILRCNQKLFFIKILIFVGNLYLSTNENYIYENKDHNQCIIGTAIHSRNQLQCKCLPGQVAQVLPGISPPCTFKQVDSLCS